MTCLEFTTKINDFNYDRIDDEQTLAEFIEHQEECNECREELELYYTLHKGLEDEEFTLDFIADLDRKLKYCTDRMSINGRIRSLTIIASVLGEIVVMLAVLIVIINVLF